MIGGAKGVGKTKLTLDVATELEFGRIETGKLVFDYILQSLPLVGLTDYITEEICVQDENLILDTHYAQYSDREDTEKKFRRGLEQTNLVRLSKKFNIYPCLIEVPVCELERRRLRDPKKRVINPTFIMQEIEFNRRGYRLYLAELNKDPFTLVNDVYLTARDNLIHWIAQNNEDFSHGR